DGVPEVRILIAAHEIGPGRHLLHPGKRLDLRHPRNGHGRTAAHSCAGEEELSMRVRDGSREPCIDALEQAEQDECDRNAQCRQNRPDGPAPQTGPHERQVLHDPPLPRHCTTRARTVRTLYTGPAMPERDRCPARARRCTDTVSFRRSITPSGMRATLPCLQSARDPRALAVRFRRAQLDHFQHPTAPASPVYPPSRRSQSRPHRASVQPSATLASRAAVRTGACGRRPLPGGTWSCGVRSSSRLLLREKLSSTMGRKQLRCNALRIGVCQPRYDEEPLTYAPAEPPRLPMQGHSRIDRDRSAATGRSPWRSPSAPAPSRPSSTSPSRSWYCADNASSSIASSRRSTAYPRVG